MTPEQQHPKTAAHMTPERAAALSTPPRDTRSLDGSNSGRRVTVVEPRETESLDGSRSGARFRPRSLEHSPVDARSLDDSLRGGFDASRRSRTPESSLGRSPEGRSRALDGAARKSPQPALPGFLAIVSEFCDRLVADGAGSRDVVYAFRDGVEARAAAVDAERQCGAGAVGDALAAASAASRAVLAADHARLARDKARLEHEVLGLRQALAARAAVPRSMSRAAASFERLRDLFDSLRSNRAEARDFESPMWSRNSRDRSLTSSPCQAPGRAPGGGGGAPPRRRGAPAACCGLWDAMLPRSESPPYDLRRESARSPSPFDLR